MLGESGGVVRPSAVFVKAGNAMGVVCDSPMDAEVVEGYEHIKGPRAEEPKRSQ